MSQRPLRRVHILRTRTADRRLEFRFAVLDQTQPIPADDDPAFLPFMRATFADSAVVNNAPAAFHHAQSVRHAQRVHRTVRGFCLIDADHLTFPPA